MRHCTTQNKSIKQYSTIEMLCRYKDIYGIALSLDDVSIKSDMRSQSGHLVDSLNVTVLDSAGGVFVLKPTISKLPAGRLDIDVVFEKDGKILASDTFSIDVDIAITNPFMDGEL